MKKLWQRYLQETCILKSEEKIQFDKITVISKSLKSGFHLPKKSGFHLPNKIVLFAPMPFKKW